MDIQLLEVSGLEVTKWLKDDETLKSIPVIAIMAFARGGRQRKVPGRRSRRLYLQTDFDSQLPADRRTFR
jgi:CheY-like chemotaxis protein